MVPRVIQDSIKSSDTVGEIKASLLFPANKIESRDGAIIPKEAVQMTKLEPSFPTEKDTTDYNQNYIWLLLGVVFIIGIGVYLFRKRRRTGR